MQLSSFVVAFAIFFLSSQPTIVDCMFMDMYGKVFQAELLDDCSVYVYDRVLFIPDTPKGWCQRPKSSLNAKIAGLDRTGKGNRYISLLAVYLDDQDNVQLRLSITNGHTEKDLVIQHKHFESPVKPREYGRYLVQRFNVYNRQYALTYEACKYGKPSQGQSKYLDFDLKAQIWHTSEARPKCDPYLMIHYPVYPINPETGIADTIIVKVYVDPKRANERICTVGNVRFVLHPIKQSIQTCALAYNMVADFHLSFPLPYSKQIDNYRPNFIGAIKNAESISFNKKNYKRPKIENDYNEQPFFFYDAKAKKYSPLFLYYKFKGTDRRFTVRFVYDNIFYDIFAPMEYMKQCKFTSQDTVAAAPRVLKQDEMSISIEVYFLINNADFQFCAFEVQFLYKGANHKVDLMLTSEINAYVHVQHRSTTAANCDYDGRTVRWLLAYSTNGDAELVSLDNSVSSPVFLCHHCGPDSKMYCDITPDAKRFHSAVLIQTVKNGKTEITYVRVIKTENYVLKTEYHTASLKGEFYFLQNMDLKLEISEIYVLLEEGKSNVNVPKVTPKPSKPDPPKVTQEPDKPDPPNVTQERDKPDTNDQQTVTSLATTVASFDENEDDYRPNWLDAGNSYFSYWWLILVAFFFFA